MFKPMHIKTSFTVFTIIAIFILAGRLDAAESNPRELLRHGAAMEGRRGQRRAHVGQEWSAAVPWGLHRVKYRHVRG
jgi:hypothetical protein